MFDEFERYTLENLCEKSIEYDPDLGKQIEEQLGLNQSNISRRNPWGNLSYAQLIDKAIKHSSQQKLTLSQIYSWISLYVPYFNKKNDKNTSQQWKNSIRHNLSLHNRFVRIPNEMNGKSSWWTIDIHAKENKQRKKNQSHSKLNKSSLTSVRQFNENIYSNFNLSSNQLILHQMLNESSICLNQENNFVCEMKYQNRNEILSTPPPPSNLTTNQQLFHFNYDFDF